MMNSIRVEILGLAAFLFLSLSCSDKPHSNTAASKSESYTVTGIVREIKSQNQTVVISHENVPNLMPAMTMPFKVRDSNVFASLRTNTPVTFRLSIQGEESWIDQITPLSNVVLNLPDQPSPQPAAQSVSSPSDRFTFTNEFGRAVNLTDFKGQPLALTFFFTRCPIPDYCPRLSKNFQEASEKLARSPDAPTNWHFLSITIDPNNDSPAALKRYAATYNYDSNHWTFLTGPRDRISNLAHGFGFEYQPDGAFFNHGFRTVIIDVSNRVQQVFPFSGNFSDSIVAEIKKASGKSPSPEK
jgi:protein SCO1/2